MRRKKSVLLPDYIPTEQEKKYYEHCIRNNIRISPIGIFGENGKWRIGISSPENYRKIYESPEICDTDTVWPVFYKYAKYYYDKHGE